VSGERDRTIAKTRSPLCGGHLPARYKLCGNFLLIGARQVFRAELNFPPHVQTHVLRAARVRVMS
jgi:hypothetical protein